MSSADKKKSQESNYPTWLLDPGHGGMIGGKYQTSGKQSPDWPDGRKLYEGEFNRAVMYRVIMLCEKAGYPCMAIVDNETDIPLKQRTKEANDYYWKVNEDCILLSIHANAGGGTGHETFTSPGETTADEYAEVLIQELVKEFPELKLRKDTKDGDNDKEAKFWMVMQTVMPAFLVECGFMDTLDPDCELLMSEEGRDRYAMTIFRAIEKINKNYKK